MDGCVDCLTSGWVDRKELVGSCWCWCWLVGRDSFTTVLSTLSTLSLLEHRRHIVYSVMLLLHVVRSLLLHCNFRYNL